MAHGPGPGGALNALDVSTATLISGAASVDTSGAVFTVIVTTAGTTLGAVYDTNATGSVAAANLIGYFSTDVGVYSFNAFPYNTGLVVVPGSGQTVSVAYT